MNAVAENALVTEQVILDILAHGSSIVMITPQGMQRLPPDGVHLVPEKMLSANVVVPEPPKVPDRSVPEAIFWCPVDEPPDVDITVMVHTPQADEPVHLGVWTGEAWESADGLTRWSPGEVVAWADVPAGRVPR